MKFLSSVVLLALFAAASAFDWQDMQQMADELGWGQDSVMEDARSNFTQLTTKYGYPSEIHNVVTKDNYILRVHRIPYGKKCGPGKPKIPVLIMHGILCSSVDFIIMGPRNGLGYILADECYDVWVGNNRGNRESMRHRYMSSNDQRFWDFSWHEMGTQDLPAMIDYILSVTKQPKLHYIGHSQGTTQFFVFASTKPEYLSKIRAAHALSPVAYMTYLKNPILRIIILIIENVIAETRSAGVSQEGFQELMLGSGILNLIGMFVCGDKYPVVQKICANILYFIGGYNPDQMNMHMLPAIIGHTPAGASPKQFTHFGQNYDSFKYFDYGPSINQEIYGSRQAPPYVVENAKVPISLFYSDNDWMADVRDVRRLASRLPNVIGMYKIQHHKFSHLDFIWGIDAPTLVYDKLIEVMKKYN